MKVTEFPEQGARLEEIIDALNLTQTSLAESLGISQSYVSQMVGGSRNISRNVLHFITKNYPEVNVRWLMTGEGEKFFPKKLAVADVVSGVMEAVAPGYEKVLRSSLRVEELPEILLSLQAEVEELRRRVEALENKNEDC